MKRFIYDEETVEEMIAEGNVGLCTSCGDENYGVEPDAEGCECEGCGDNAVVGFENLIMMGAIKITANGES